jgi:hypothetical protein
VILLLLTVMVMVWTMHRMPFRTIPLKPWTRMAMA